MAAPPTTPPTITSFSGLAPSRTDPATFSARTDARLGEWQPNVDETNAAIAWENSTAQEVYDNAVEAAASSAAAGVSETNAGLSETAAADSAIEAANSASSASADFTATSSTSLLIEAASKVFAIETGKSFVIGQIVKAASSANPTNQMVGEITATSSGSITVLVSKIGGSGTLADWSISLTTFVALNVATAEQLDYSTDTTIPDSFVVALNPDADLLVAELSTSDVGDRKRLINVSAFTAYVRLVGSNVFSIAAGETLLVFKVGVIWYAVKDTTETGGAVVNFGFSDVFNAGSTNNISITDLSPTKIAVAYQDAGNSNAATAVIGDISGSVVTFGSEYVFNTGVSTIHISIASTLSTQIVIAYQDNPSGGVFDGKAIIGDISGTVISFGAEYVFNANQTKYTSITALSSTKIAIAYEDDATGDNGTAIIGDISGTVITFGSGYVFNGGVDVSSMYSTALSGSSFAIAYQDLNNLNYGTLVVGSVLGTVISFGNKYVFNAGTTSSPVISALSASKISIAYQDLDYGTAIVGDVIQ